jgi:hypothetical protein
MAIMDPLLNTGFLWRCLGAYAGIKADDEPPQDEISPASVTTPEKRRKLDQDITSPSQLVPDEDQPSDHMRKDTYYARLST